MQCCEAAPREHCCCREVHFLFPAFQCPELRGETPGSLGCLNIVSEVFLNTHGFPKSDFLLRMLLFQQPFKHLFFCGMILIPCSFFPRPTCMPVGLRCPNCPPLCFYLYCTAMLCLAQLSVLLEDFLFSSLCGINTKGLICTNAKSKVF